MLRLVVVGLARVCYFRSPKVQALLRGIGEVANGS
jgi:hypothetical protein